MKSLCAKRITLLLSCMLALCVLCVYPGQATAVSNDKVYTSITSQELYDIMEEHGCNVEFDDDADDVEDDTSLVFKIDGKRTILIFYDDNKAVQLYCVDVNTDVTLEDVNDWNKTHRFSRAYLDDDEDPCLELDLDLAGGVTAAQIKEYLDTCVMSVYTWEKEYVKK